MDPVLGVVLTVSATMKKLLLTGIAALLLATGTVQQSAKSEGVRISVGGTAGKWELSINFRGECILEKLYSENWNPDAKYDENSPYWSPIKKRERASGVIVFADIPDVERALKELKKCVRQ